jgi:ABC-type polar amino acid transport system ATPase subunit
MVSSGIPLWANLSVLENIMLVKDYHDRWGEPRPPISAHSTMEKFGIADTAELKPSNLDELTTFKVKLIRALMLPNAAVGIDRPFSQLHDLYDINPVIKLLDTVEKQLLQCIFFDYEGNRKRYGSLVE